MKVSVIIPTYKRADFLKGCLESLWQQKRKPDEIVLVIRPEDKTSLEIIRSFEARVKDAFQMKTATIEKPGVVFAENEGLRHASGEILCFIDDDATARPDWIQRIESHF